MKSLARLGSSDVEAVGGSSNKRESSMDLGIIDEARFDGVKAAALTVVAVRGL